MKPPKAIYQQALYASANNSGCCVKCGAGAGAETGERSATLCHGQDLQVSTSRRLVEDLNHARRNRSERPQLPLCRKLGRFW